MEQHDHRDGTYKKEAWVTVAFWDEGLSLIGFVTVLVRTVRVIFPSHRQSGTGSVVLTATCATSALSQITSTTKTDTENWVDFQLAQRKGLKFYQTRSNAVILYDALPAYYISKAIAMKSEEIIYQKVYVSPRPPPTISNKDNWTCSSDSDVARSSTDIQRVELKPNTQLSRTGRPVTKRSEETLERTKFDRDTLNQQKHDNVTDSTSTGRPVCGHESTERCVLTPKHVERDQTSTGRPITVDPKEDTTLISECQDCHTQL